MGEDSHDIERLINSYLFYPPRDFVADPGVLGLPFENIWLTTEDGVKIHGWFVPNQTAEQTLLYLHGNAENVSHLLPILHQLFAAGFQIFALDYRGYGRSEGSPTEEGIYLDARAAWEWLYEEIGGSLVVYGRSLGGAVALWLATAPGVAPCAVVVESTFTSGWALVQQLYPIPELAPLRPDFFPSLDRVPQLHTPLMVIHGEADEVVPLAHGQAIFAAAREPKAFAPVQGAHHNDVSLVAGKALTDQLASFLQGVC